VTLGARIRAARQDLGLSQAEFARRLRVGPNEPYRWETDRHAPRVRQLQKIAAVTGRPAGWFIDGDSLDVRPGRALEEVPK
jgi:HTH-type transcriptional regulator, cell division transcriptional repressor